MNTLPPLSIRTRLILGGALVLAGFVAAAGLALERAYSESVLAARFDKLQTDVYVLMAAAEVNAKGHIVMPPTLAETRFSIYGSGLYAYIHNATRPDDWESTSTVGQDVPFSRGLPPGKWHVGQVQHQGKIYLTAAYGVSWPVGKLKNHLTFTVTEDDARYRHQITQFRTTLWSWLGSVTLGLLLAQTLLLSWGLLPLRRVAREIHRIEHGEQSLVTGRYPTEIVGLTSNLNTLLEQERARQTRYRDALADLAHSLKTPLAVLRSALGQPHTLAHTVDEQVMRMDRIVQHQLGRAATSGAVGLAPPLILQPILQRVVESLAKVYADKHLQFAVHCAADIQWRLDEGDTFELTGNLLDNAAKWARHQVLLSASCDSTGLTLQIEDDGPGIADPQAVLGRGVRADEQVPGQGIGLAVVVDIIAAYRGTLHIDRSPLGGARIGLRFPALLANAAASAAMGNR